MIWLKKQKVKGFFRGKIPMLKFQKNEIKKSKFQYSYWNLDFFYSFNIIMYNLKYLLREIKCLQQLIQEQQTKPVNLLNWKINQHSF